MQPFLGLSPERFASNQEMSMGIGKQQSAERSLSSSLENNAHLGDVLSNSTNTQKVFGEMTEQQVGNAMQMTNRAVDKLSKDANISKAESAQLLASVGSPQLAKLVTGLEASTAMESSSASQETIAKAKEISKDFNFEQNARTAFQASEHLSKTSTDDNVKSLARNQQSSLSEAAHQNQSANKHIENAKRLSKEADYTESNSASINRNYNDKLISYIAGHEAPNVGGKIGKRGATGIISRNDDETQTYLDHFMRDHAPKPAFSMSQAQSLLQKEYDGTQLEKTVDKNSVENFHQQSKNEINHDLSAESQGIENRVKGNIAGTNKFIKGAQADIIDPERAKLQKDYDRQSTDVGVVTAIKGGLSAVKNAADSPQNFVHEKIEDVKEAYQTIVHGEKVSPEYTNIPQMLKASLKDSAGSEDLNGGYTQKQSIPHKESSKGTSHFTSLHDGSVESLFKHQNNQEELRSPKVIKIKEVSMKQEGESIEKLNAQKEMLIKKEAQ
jgi:uncharacterized protein (UPF0305 family)